MTPVRASERPEPDGSVRGPPAAGAGAVAGAQLFTSRRSVTVGMLVAIMQTVALAVAAVVTGSAALKTQTATNLADVAVSAFLLIAVVSSNRPADDSHLLGYGRERFFWSFVAAVGYGVLAVIILLDALALTVGLRPLRQSAHDRRLPLARFLWHSTDPAVTTLVLSSAAGLAGGLVAAAGLAGREITGRALSPAQAGAMRRLIADQSGVLADLFAVVVGPSSVIVDADVVFDDGLDVPEVETVIVSAAAALSARWPPVAYVYLNPVAQHRPRRFTPTANTAPTQPRAGP